MNPSVASSLERFVQTFADQENLQAGPVLQPLNDAFDSEQPFMQKTEAMDRCFNDYPHFEPLREPCFDLLLMNFFSSDIERLEGDYLESEEWETIEEKTLDRGTEILNVLLYLRECKDQDLQINLNDFLKEFLLVEEDEFQDEHRIYEPMITHQMLEESNFQEIARIASSLDPSGEITELFYPMMSFFNEPDPSDAQFEAFTASSNDPGFDTAVYRLLTTYYTT